MNYKTLTFKFEHDNDALLYCYIFESGVTFISPYFWREWIFSPAQGPERIDRLSPETESDGTAWISAVVTGSSEMLFDHSDLTLITLPGTSC